MMNDSSVAIDAEKKIYVCEKCGGILHKATEEEEKNLACPEYGTVNEPEDILLWD